MKNKYTNWKAYNRGEGKRNEIYVFIKEFIKIHGFSPTLKEIGAAVGLNFCSVRKHLDQMVESGLIERTGVKGSPRNIFIPRRDI